MIQYFQLSHLPEAVAVCQAAVLVITVTDKPAVQVAAPEAVMVEQAVQVILHL
jgi:hypothetical protein